MTPIAGQSGVDLAITIATVVAGLVALGAIAGYVRRTYRRSLGRRRDSYERIGRLGVGAQLSFFESILGEPPAIRRTVIKEGFVEWVGPDDPRFDPSAVEDPDLQQSHEVRDNRPFLQSIFVDRNFFVQTITDDDETVLAFSVTSRNRRFSPKFEWPPHLGWRERRRISKMIGSKYKPLFHVRLGETRFSDFGDEERVDFAGARLELSVGAHNYAYSEFQYHGNPGAYQDFVFTASDVAPGAWGNAMSAMDEMGGHEWPRDGDDRRWNELVHTRAFRRGTAITTYTVVGMDLLLENYPTTFAPHDNLVRTLP